MTGWTVCKTVIIIENLLKLKSASQDFISSSECIFCVAGVCIEGNDIQPESGSIVAGVLEAQNIGLYCDLRNEQGDRLIVNWFIQSRQSRENGMDPGSIRGDDDRFIQSGDNVSPDVNTSLNNNFTILSLTDDLDEAIIICGFDRPVANFTLRIYRKSYIHDSHTMSCSCNHANRSV